MGAVFLLVSIFAVISCILDTTTANTPFFDEPTGGTQEEPTTENSSPEPGQKMVVLCGLSYDAVNKDQFQRLKPSLRKEICDLAKALYLDLQLVYSEALKLSYQNAPETTDVLVRILQKVSKRLKSTEEELRAATSPIRTKGSHEL